MQKDLPEPLLMQVNGCLNLRSLLKTDLSVHCHISLYTRSGWNYYSLGASLEKGDSVHFILGLCDYTYSPICPLSFDISLCVYSYYVRLTTFQNHFPNHVTVYQLGSTVVQSYSPDFAHRFPTACRRSFSVPR